MRQLVTSHGVRVADDPPAGRSVRGLAIEHQAMARP